jgi:hypothetical protein
MMFQMYVAILADVALRLQRVMFYFMSAALIAPLASASGTSAAGTPVQLNCTSQEAAQKHSLTLPQA